MSKEYEWQGLKECPKGAHVYIQWKGTEVCMDVHCECGNHAHSDAEFAYFVECAKCHRIYEVGCYTRLYVVSHDQRADVQDRAILTDHNER